MIESFRRLLRSFIHAWEGICILFVTQRNMRIHLVAAFGAIGGGIWLRLSRYEWLWVLLAISLVIVAEALNSAIEFVCDRLSPDYDPLIKKAKDTAAGGVLIAALLAVAIGVGVFGPRLTRLLT